MKKITLKGKHETPYKKQFSAVQLLRPASGRCGQGFRAGFCPPAAHITSLAGTKSLGREVSLFISPTSIPAVTDRQHTGHQTGL